jgi:hypothetical protein
MSVLKSGLTKKGCSNRRAENSKGQCPSLACSAEVNRTAFLNAVSAFSQVISSLSPNLTDGILRSIPFSLISCIFELKENRINDKMKFSLRPFGQLHEKKKGGKINHSI